MSRSRGQDTSGDNAKQASNPRTLRPGGVLSDPSPDCSSKPPNSLSFKGLGVGAIPGSDRVSTPGRRFYEELMAATNCASAVLTACWRRPHLMPAPPLLHGACHDQPIPQDPALPSGLSERPVWAT